MLWHITLLLLSSYRLKRHSCGRKICPGLLISKTLLWLGTHWTVYSWKLGKCQKMTESQNESSLSALGGHLLQPRAHSRIRTEIRPVCTGVVQPDTEILQAADFITALGSVRVPRYPTGEKKAFLVRTCPVSFPQSYAPLWRDPSSLVTSSNVLESWC